MGRSVILQSDVCQALFKVRNHKFETILYSEDDGFLRDTCGDHDQFQAWAEGQTLADLVTGVSCEEDCRYNCMWLTVEEMEVSTENITSVLAMKMIDIFI